MNLLNILETIFLNTKKNYLKDFGTEYAPYFFRNKSFSITI